MATWRDHAAIVDAIEAKDLEEARRRLDRHYEGIARVIANNKTSANMLNAARSTAVLEQYPWQWLFPGGALILAVLAINFIGDGLRDAFDPRTELN